MKSLFNFFNSTWTEHQALQWISNIMGWLHLALGVAVIVGGEKRFSFPTYQPLIDMTHGHTWIWGVWIIFSGLLMTIPARWFQISGLWMGMVWNVMWCSLFAVAIVQYPTAGATASVAYGGLAMIDAALLTARMLDHDDRR